VNLLYEEGDRERERERERERIVSYFERSQNFGEVIERKKQEHVSFNIYRVGFLREIKKNREYEKNEENTNL